MCIPWFSTTARFMRAVKNDNTDTIIKLLNKINKYDLEEAFYKSIIYGNNATTKKLFHIFKHNRAIITRAAMITILENNDIMFVFLYPYCAKKYIFDMLLYDKPRFVHSILHFLTEMDIKIAIHTALCYILDSGIVLDNIMVLDILFSKVKDKRFIFNMSLEIIAIKSPITHEVILLIIKFLTFNDMLDLLLICDKRGYFKEMKYIISSSSRELLSTFMKESSKEFKLYITDLQ